MTSNKLNISDKLIIFIFATLPVAIIIGNFLINFHLFCIFLLFVFNIFKTKNFTWFKDKYFKIILFFYIYICLNSFVNYYKNPSFGYDGIIRSLFFLKFLFLLPAIPILLDKQEKLDKILKIWVFIIFILIIDVFFEKYVGSNLLGFKSLDETRIASFFYDENVVGTFLFGFGFITTAFFLQKRVGNKKKVILNFTLIIILLSILVTGERSAFLKSAILFLLIFYFIDGQKIFIKKIYLLVLIIFLAVPLVMIFPNIIYKQTEFFKRIMVVENPNSISQRFENIKYFQHYNTAIEIFKNNKLNGIGNKNFRFECLKEKYFNENSKFTHHRCSTHPHQLHFELLSEQGLIGYLIFIFFLFSYFNQKFLTDLRKKDIFRITMNFYLIVFLIPILPSGSLFSTFNGFLFWFFLGLSNLKKIES